MSSLERPARLRRRPRSAGPARAGARARLDLLKPLKRPLDGGVSIGERRVFGDNKTWRGALFMICGPTLAALALTRWPAFRDAPGVWLCLAPVYVLGLGTVAVAFVAVTVVHLAINVIGHAVGARSSRI